MSLRSLFARGRRPAVGRRDRRLLAPLFDPRWYVSFHGIHLMPPYEDAFEHYLAIGAPAGFSPGPAFDESAYLAMNEEVAALIDRGTYLCGHHHYVVVGRDAGRAKLAVEGDRASAAPHPLQSDHANLVRRYFDARWYVETNPDVARALGAGRDRVPSPLWHYISSGAAEGRSPNAWFDEAWYLRRYLDVAEARRDGRLPSAFCQYLLTGRREGRQPNGDPLPGSNELYPGLSRPIGIQRLGDVERSLTPFPWRLYPANDERRVCFLMPTLDRNLLFGGYLAALHFIDSLQRRGWPVRILVTEDVHSDQESAQAQFGAGAAGSLTAEVLARAEVVNLARRDVVLDVGAGDRFVAYSMWTALHAHALASATGRRFLFFIQDYEPTFHQHDCWHALGASAYRLPHFAIFNSESLRRYFASHGLGIYARSDDAGDPDCVVFEHALSIARPPGPGELRREPMRRLLFYARPESHCARNLFELGVTALRRAVSAGTFAGDEWSFDGVGTHSTTTVLPLGRGKELVLRPRLEVGDYAQALRGFELGLSLQYGPHPGVVGFEMAASGMVVVVNTFEQRTAAELLGRSANLVPVEPTPDAIAAGLAASVVRSRDVEASVRGAQGPWVTSWRQSFDDDVMRAVEAELG